MFMTLLTVAAAAQAAVPAAPAIAATPTPVAARPLSGLPDNKVAYFDVQGKTMPAIHSSLNAILANPVANANAKLFTWNVGAQVIKRTEGQKCTVQRATAKLSSTVNLPRLAEAAKAAKPVLATWQAYVAGLEADAAANLWFVHDQLRGAEQAVVGVDCTAMNAAWNAAMNKINLQHAQFAAARAAASTPAPAPAAPKPKP